MRTVALIPVKFINRRLPGKNTKLLGGKPLMATFRRHSCK